MSKGALLSCELCGFTGDMDPFYPVKGIVRCPCCRLVFCRLSVDSRSLYGADYFQGKEYRDYVADKASLQKNFQRYVDILLSYTRGGRLLEVGSAYGFFLQLAQRHWDVSGIDITAAGVQYARNVLKVPVRQAEILDLPEEPEAYDVVCLWDTLEHLVHPVRTLEKACRWLKPGGLLALTTGDIGSWMSRWRRDRWRLIHPPTHLFYFSRDVLRKAMEVMKMEVRQMRFMGYYRSWKSMWYQILNRRGEEDGRLFKILTVGGRFDPSIYLNLFDIVMLIAQKPAAAGAPRSGRRP